MALVTAAEVRSSQLPQITGTAEDTKLETLIGQAEAALARWLGFPRADDGTYALEAKTYTFYPKGPSAREPRKLVLPIRPIVSVTSIYQDTDESYTTLVESSDYFVDRLPDGIVFLKQSPACGAWLSGDRPIKATVVAGWSTAPSHIVQAVAYQVQYALGQGRTGGAQSQTVAGKSSSAADPSAGIDPRAARLLTHERIWEAFVG